MALESNDDEQFMDFKCPACGEEISFPASAADSIEECFGCDEPVVLPGDGGPARKVPLPHDGSRVTLRRFRANDWKELIELFSNEEFFSIAPVKLEGEEQISRWLEQDAVVKLTTPNTRFILAVEAKETGKVVGCLSLYFSDAERRQGVMDIAIHPDFKEAGYGVEGARAMFEFCFQGILLHRVQSFCTASDAAACQLWDGTGMRREAEFIKDRKVSGQWVNTIAFAVLREEFKVGTK